MHDLYKLKDMLVEELKEFGKKGELSTGSLDTIDTLAHATKNLEKVIECEEDEEQHEAPFCLPDRSGGNFAACVGEAIQLLKKFAENSAVMREIRDVILRQQGSRKIDEMQKQGREREQTGSGAAVDHKQLLILYVVAR